MNSYAIEDHYFNFSTTGQWLWEELHLALPAGKDPYAAAGSHLAARWKRLRARTSSWQRASGAA